VRAVIARNTWPPAQRGHNMKEFLKQALDEKNATTIQFTVVGLEPMKVELSYYVPVTQVEHVDLVRRIKQTFVVE
jgi:hypothetical protein